MPCSHSCQSRRTSYRLFRETRTTTNPSGRLLDASLLSFAQDAEGGRLKLLDRILSDSLASLLHHLQTLTQIILIADHHPRKLMRRNIMGDHFQQYSSRNLARTTFLISLFPIHQHNHRMRFTHRKSHSKSMINIISRHTFNHTAHRPSSLILNPRHLLSIRPQSPWRSLDHFHSILF